MSKPFTAVPIFSKRVLRSLVIGFGRPQQFKESIFSSIAFPLTGTGGLGLGAILGNGSVGAGGVTGSTGAVGTLPLQEASIEISKLVDINKAVFFMITQVLI